MPQLSNAVEMFNREFLEMRARLLDLAAALDRIERREGAAAVAADPRYAQVSGAIGILMDSKPDRAERVQMVFSDPYKADWQKGTA